MTKKIGGYPISEARKIAAGAARSYLRSIGVDPNDATPLDAEAALDDLLRKDSATVAAMFWFEASNNQVKIFRKEWRR